MHKLINLAFLSIFLKSLHGYSNVRMNENVDLNEEERKKFGFIFRNRGSLYGERILDGYKEAAKELDAEVIADSPATQTVVGQINIIDRFINNNVDLIAISGNDYNGLQSATARAMTEGIPVISYDAPINADSRILHVSPVSPEDVGRVLLEAADELLDGSGEIAVISTTEPSPNQAAWNAMELLLLTPAYEDLSLDHVIYGQEDLNTVIKETEKLIQNNPHVSLIIAPSTVSMLGAAQVINDYNLQGTIELTGIGSPCDIQPYLENGTVKQFYIWDAIDLGYLTGYVSDAIVNERVVGLPGEVIPAGRLGEFTIQEDLSGGREVVLGGLEKITKDNIDNWLYLC